MAEETVKAVQVKLVLLGEAAVGKSSLVSRFVQNDFNENTSPTIGAAFLTQKCRLENRTVKFEIWDTAGQERFHSLAPMYYRNAQAAVVVYDITKAASLEKAKSWVKELQRQASPNIVIALVGNKLDLVSESDSNPPAVSAEAVGSEDATETPAEDSEEGEDKSDDDESSTPTKTKNSSSTPAATSTSDQTSSLRQISTSEASQYASESKLLFTEASAKTGQGVQEIFELIAKTIPIEAAPATGATTGTAAGSAGQRGQRGQQREGVSLTEAQQKKGGCC